MNRPNTLRLWEQPWSAAGSGATLCLNLAFDRVLLRDNSDRYSDLLEMISAERQLIRTRSAVAEDEALLLESSGSFDDMPERDIRVHEEGKWITTSQIIEEISIVFLGNVENCAVRYYVRS